MPPPNVEHPAWPRQRLANCRTGAARRSKVAVLAPPLLVGVMGLACYSVVRYHPAIVAGYVLAAAALVAHLVRPGAWSVSAQRRGTAAALATAGLLTWFVPTFTYLPMGPHTVVRAVLGGAALLAASALATARPSSGDLALGLTLTGYLVSATLLIRLDPAPSIDVWYTLQGAADALAAGRDVYREVWLGPPGVMAAFTYLPWTAVLLAPGRWLAGDVRWALVVVTVLAALAVRFLPTHRPNRAAAAGLAALLLVVPGTATQVEQAWTEPLLLACLAGATWALRRRRVVAAVVLLALGMACKQHLALLLPLLAAWPRFGLRRAVATGAVAGVLVSPWLVLDARAFLDDTVLLLVRYPEMLFADTLYVLSVNEWGLVPPFWLTGAVILTAVVSVSVRVRRDEVDVAVWLRYAALVLLVANLVNKQGFYNQYWLVAALVLLSWAAAEPVAEPTDRPDSGVRASPDDEASDPQDGSEPDSGGQATVQPG